MRTDASCSRAASALYSRALLLASSRASPARERPTAHESARALAHRARRAAPPTRHSRYPAASDADEKPLPCAVTTVPPSASARAGTSQLTADAGWYVKRAAPAAAPPAAPYCRAFTESATRAAPSPRAADAHSNCAPSTRRASTAPEPLPIRQRTVDASRPPTPAPPPPPPPPPDDDDEAIATATRVPPRSGPSGGDSCTPTHPVTALAGDTHRTPDAASPKAHRTPPAGAPTARTPTTVAPRRGPLHGCTSSTRTDASCSRAASALYSRALLLASSRASP